jgi:hypothetical protein
LAEEQTTKGDCEEVGKDWLKDCLHWIEQEQSVMEAYHNHKENMAWGATALYVGMVAVAHQGRAYAQTCTLSVIESLVIVIAGYLVFLFVQMQFKMRWEAADIIDAFRATRMKLSGWTSDKCQMQDFETEPDNGQNGMKGRWPKLIAAAIKSHSLSREDKFKQALKKIHRPKKFTREVLARVRSELVSYLSIALVTMISVAIIWVPLEQKPENPTINGGGAKPEEGSDAALKCHSEKSALSAALRKADVLDGERTLLGEQLSRDALNFDKIVSEVEQLDIAIAKIESALSQRP